MLAINDATADAMLGSPDSDLWHHDMDKLLHNVNDLMRRLDQRQVDGASEDAEQEGDGGFFTHEPAGNAAEPQGSSNGTFTETQVLQHRANDKLQLALCRPDKVNHLSMTRCCTRCHFM